MKVLDSLPSRPLMQADVQRFRTDESINGFIELEASRVYQNGGLHEAVALTERTVVSLSFENGTWNREILARDADKQRHVQEALRQLPED